MSPRFAVAALAALAFVGCKREPDDFAVLVHRQAMVAARNLGDGRDLTEREIADTRERCQRCPACEEICAQLESSFAPKPDLARPIEHHESSFGPRRP